MGPLIEQKVGWTHSWRNCGTAAKPSFTAFFTNTQIRANIVYTYNDLMDVTSDPLRKSQIPQEILQAALDKYPNQDQGAAKAVA